MQPRASQLLDGWMDVMAATVTAGVSYILATGQRSQGAGAIPDACMHAWHGEGCYFYLFSDMFVWRRKVS